MAGLAATSINSPPCKPVNILSRSIKPVDNPVTLPLFLAASSISLITFITMFLIGVKSEEPFLL